MAVRTAYVPAAGTAITAANHVKFPGGWIGYVEITATQTGIVSEADVTGLSVTVTVGTSRRLRLQANARLLQNTGSASPIVSITDGSNVHLTEWQHSMAATNVVTAQPIGVETPSSGSNTFKVRAATSGGTTLDVQASSTVPAFILVEDIGPSA